MRARYEVTYVLMGTTHVARQCLTFNAARDRARVLAAEMSGELRTVSDHVIVRDTKNDNAVVWREPIRKAPALDIPCHSPTHKGTH